MPNPWIEFRVSNKGQGLRMAQLSRLYRQAMNARRPLLRPPLDAVHARGTEGLRRLLCRHIRRRQAPDSSSSPSSSSSSGSSRRPGPAQRQRSSTPPRATPPPPPSPRLPPSPPSPPAARRQQQSRTSSMSRPPRQPSSSPSSSSGSKRHRRMNRSPPPPPSVPASPRLPLTRLRRTDQVRRSSTTRAGVRARRSATTREDAQARPTTRLQTRRSGQPQRALCDGRGLPNFGNTCFLNALVHLVCRVPQVLVAGSPLATFMARPTARTARQVVAGACRLQFGHQQDAKEAWDELSSRHPVSINVNPFRLQVWDTRSADADTSIQEDTQSGLQLPVNGTRHQPIANPSVQRLVDFYYGNEQRLHTAEDNGGDPWKYSDDRWHDEWLESTRIVNPPDLLLIQLKRFRRTESNILQKITRRVRVGRALVTRDAGLTHWRLAAVVLHHGDRLEGGHYTALVERNGNWQHYDDDDVAGLTEDAALDMASRQGYMFLYVRADGLQQVPANIRLEIARRVESLRDRANLGLTHKGSLHVWQQAERAKSREWRATVSSLSQQAGAVRRARAALTAAQERQRAAFRSMCLRSQRVSASSLQA